MKTKLTLFVTVLAAALSGVGCASVPKPDVANAVKWNGHWYAVFPDQLLTGPEAQALCEKMGGHLVVISSKEENKFVENLAAKTGKYGDYNVGALKEGTPKEAPQKKWQWVNGEPFSTGYKNWGLNDLGKDFPPENRVMMWIFETDRRSGQWASVQEAYAGRCICEWE